MIRWILDIIKKVTINLLTVGGIILMLYWAWTLIF